MTVTISRKGGQAMSALLTLQAAPAFAAQLSDHGDQASPWTIILSAILEWQTGVRSSFRRLVLALPHVPAALSTGLHRLQDETAANGLLPAVVILGLILLASFSGEWIVRHLLHRLWREHQPTRHSAVEILPLTTFLAISSLLYLAFDWPDLTGAVLFFYLTAAVVIRFIWAALETARNTGALTSFTFRRFLSFAAILLLALATDAAANSLSIDRDAVRSVTILLSAVLLVMSLEAVWRHAATSGVHILRVKVLRTAGLLALWILWLLDLQIAFWIGLYAIVLPVLLPFLAMVARSYAAVRWPGGEGDRVSSVIAVRGLRAFAVAIAVLWLIVVWQYSASGSSRLHALADILILGLFKSVIILLIADLGWSVAKAVIDRKLDRVAAEVQLSPAQAGHRARLRTLLPIFRNALAALVLVITALTVLTELGIEVGPLIAGAGIFGVAIGFGSQTLVKDVISGLFYLMDDAFRIGEYIQSGSYMGTVESFSLRSIRLRHHRGPIFTVPFGELGAVQNMSRDWAIEKFILRLNFDADIAKAKKLVKKIGADLLEDPELGPLIIEPLKLKGVEQIGDFGIEVSFTFTAVPGNQSMIRRSAQAMIREAFLDNGIGFAQPTMQVSGYDMVGSAGVAAMTARKRTQLE